MKPMLVRTIAAASQSRKAAHRIISWACLGSIESISSGESSTKDAVVDLFTEDNYMELKRHRMNKSLTECFKIGLGIEDKRVAELKEALVLMRSLIQKSLNEQR